MRAGSSLNYLDHIKLFLQRRKQPILGRYVGDKSQRLPEPTLAYDSTNIAESKATDEVVWGNLQGVESNHGLILPAFPTIRIRMNRFRQGVTSQLLVKTAKCWHLSNNQHHQT